MDDVTEYMDGQPLLTYQIDVSRLYNVLQALNRSQSQQAASLQQLSKRFVSIEGSMQTLADRITRVERDAAHGSAEELRTVRLQLNDVGVAVDQLSRQLPDIKSQGDEVRRTVSAHMRDVGAMDQRYDAALADVSQALSDQRRTTSTLASQVDAVSHLEPRVSELMRELQVRSDRVERDLGGRWQDALDELNTRMNDNFKIVEESSRELDAEIAKLSSLHTDVANLRGDLNSVDNTYRQKFGRLTEDTDEKYKLLLTQLQKFERANASLEEHLLSAGRALSSRTAGVIGGPAVTGSGRELGGPRRY